MWATLQKIRKMGAVTSRIARLARVWGDFGQTNFLIFVLTWRSATTSSVVRLLVVEDVCRCCRIRIARWVFSTIPRMQFNITCTGCHSSFLWKRFFQPGRSSTPPRHSSHPLVASVDRSNNYHRKTIAINTTPYNHNHHCNAIATTVLLVVDQALQPALDLKMLDMYNLHC